MSVDSIASHIRSVFDPITHAICMIFHPVSKVGVGGCH